MLGTCTPTTMAATGVMQGMNMPIGETAGASVVTSPPVPPPASTSTTPAVTPTTSAAAAGGDTKGTGHAKPGSQAWCHILANRVCNVGIYSHVLVIVPVAQIIVVYLCNL